MLKRSVLLLSVFPAALRGDVWALRLLSFLVPPFLYLALKGNGSKPHAVVQSVFMSRRHFTQNIKTVMSSLKCNICVRIMRF